MPKRTARRVDRRDRRHGGRERAADRGRALPGGARSATRTLIADPQGELARLCEFIGVEPEPEYLEACAAIVYESPHRTRERVEWSDADRRAVDELVARHDFLRGYSFED